MDRRTRLKLMELNAKPARTDDLTPLDMLRMIVRKVESGEMRCRDLNLNAYANDSIEQDITNGRPVVMRGDQYYVVNFVLEPGGEPTRNNDDDARNNDGDEQPTRKEGERDLIFD